MAKPLQIISASAGSGKTYKLVLTYLKLLLESSKAEPFAHIVAMTFTNKAAFEMKSRIVKALEVLSFPDQFKEEERKYEKVLCNELNYKPVELAEKSKRILLKILHRYEDFKVLTIDKFNLQLIRSFSHELDLPADFEVIIDEDEVLEKVVDQLLSEIGNAEKLTLTNLVVSYAQSQLEEGEKWNFRNDLIQFIGLIKSEKEQKIIDKLLILDFSEGDFQKIKAKLQEEKGSYLTFVGEFKNYVDSTNCFSFPKKIAGGLTTLNIVEKYLNSKLPESQFMTVTAVNNLSFGNKTNSPISGMAEKLEEMKVAHAAFYKKITLLNANRKNYHNLWLLKILAGRLELMRKDESLIRISEFNHLIGKLVQNEEAPFLYERMGNRYENFLLDEFQDTSRMQWLNLIPLVHEGISKLNLNFIVGDPKQSIYRFKNGLAEQFVVLPKIYNPENDTKLAQKSHFFNLSGEKSIINQNWRSTKTIVEFNNAFFCEWRKNLPESTSSFFDDVEQEPISEEIGYVHFQSIEEIKGQTDDSLPQLLQWIQEAIDDGFKPNEIFILGRNNRECNQWAIQLTELGFKVVSADSLFVDSDLYVQWIIAYLQKRRSPSIENLTKKFISITLLVKELSISVYEDYFHKTEDSKYKRLDENRFIRDFFGKTGDFYFSYESIYDAITKFCNMVKIDPLKNHYVHHLLNMAFLFDLRFGPDLQLFLEQYRNKGRNSSVQLPENEDSMTIMTIHKSKGLEFPIVILPKIKLTDENQNKTKYFVPFEGQIVQLTGSQTENIPEFAPLSLEEKEQINTDNTNIYYVAFTRAKTRIYARNVFKPKKNSENLRLACLNSFSKGWDDEKINLILGERKKKVENHHGIKSVERNFIPTSLHDFLWFPNIAIENKNPFDEEYILSDAQLFGNQFHLLLYEIEHVSQIDDRLDFLIDRGEIDRSNRQKIKSQAEQIFTKFLNELYQKCNVILSEQSILFANEKSSRPDKILILPDEIIVLDFKTGTQVKKHEDQVKQYVHLLVRMGKKNVRAALLYTEIPKLIWVN